MEEQTNEAAKGLAMLWSTMDSCYGSSEAIEKALQGARTHSNCYILLTEDMMTENIGRIPSGFCVESMDGKTVHPLPSLLECNEILVMKCTPSQSSETSCPPYSRVGVCPH